MDTALAGGVERRVVENGGQRICRLLNLVFWQKSTVLAVAINCGHGADGAAGPGARML